MLGVHLHGNLKGKVSENVVFGMAWSLRWGLFAQKYERKGLKIIVHGQGFTLHKCEGRVSENGVLSH